ncbi:DedA family protein [Dictyobacter arantiisoli]|uniref:Membrane protein n=1 Tax=Dictyobacter arantiisoli TaxID=2014874 RepID=A0A5A5T7U9_9CHLR|nr:DedA family protein [Dictyobacter arantiisoli]GCF07477.1 membrane protein [Dictyobacter arantiisoli]
MSTLLPLILTWLQIYGYPALWVCVCIAAIGLPLPIGLLLLATGAFAALGDFNVILLFITTLTASVCGDSIGYLIGRKLGSRIIDWLSTQKRIRFISPKVVVRSQEYFQRRGIWAIFLSRCLVPALGGSINILAGAERYPYRKFLLADALGETIGIMPSLILGFAFGTSWEEINNLMTTASILLFLLLIAVYLVVLLVRTLRRMQAARAQTEITAETEPKKLQSLEVMKVTVNAKKS